LKPKAIFPTDSRSIRASLRICLGQLVQNVRDVSGDRRLGDVELAGDAGEEWPSCWEAVSALTRSEM
jgi:hypothetical protein